MGPSFINFIIQFLAYKFRMNSAIGKLLSKSTADSTFTSLLMITLKKD